MGLAIVPNLVAYTLSMNLMPVLGLAMTTFLPLPMFVEGGIFYILTGVLLYLFRKIEKFK